MSPAIPNSIEHYKYTKGFYMLLTLSSVSFSFYIFQLITKIDHT